MTVYYNGGRLEFEFEPARGVKIMPFVRFAPKECSVVLSRMKEGVNRSEKICFVPPEG